MADRGSNSDSFAGTPADGARSPDAGTPADAGTSGLPARRVSSGELERIFSRAAKLQFDEGEDVTDLDVGEVVRIAEEVGLERRHVRRALAEVQAESLLPTLPVDGGLPARLWGPGVVRHSRAVRGDPSEVQARLERHLEEKESLHGVRQKPGRSLWEPAAGLIKQMQRSLDVGGHGYDLAKARNVQLAVEGLEEGWSLVTLSVDIRNLRAGQATGWLLGLGASGTAGAVGSAILVGTGAAIVIAPFLAIGFLGLASWAAGRTIHKARDRIELAVLGLLDRLEQGQIGAEKDGSGWREWLLTGSKPGRPDGV